MAEGPCFEGFTTGLEVVEVQVGKGGGSRLIYHAEGCQYVLPVHQLILRIFVVWICETGARPTHRSGPLSSKRSSAEVSLPDKYEEHKN